VSLRRAAILAAVLVAVAVPAAASGGAPAKRLAPPKLVTVADDYFAPVKLPIYKGRRVKWRWDQFNTNSHNVTLTRVHPPGVRRRDFRSISGTVGINFVRRFTVPGKYGFVCTLHSTVMRMNVIVRRPPTS
jgi:plastocyanin